MVHYSPFTTSNTYTDHIRDAWKQQNGLSRTEAKRRYITTLIDTMHKYASPSADSRELVSELEFVWDQVKSNVPSSSSSSPLQTLASLGLHIPQHYPGSPQSRDPDDDRGLQIRSPMSQSEEDGLEEEEEQQEEFVDAPDSQYNPVTEPEDIPRNPSGLTPQPPEPIPVEPVDPPARPQPKGQKSSGNTSTSEDQKWKKRVEQALVKMTAEVAALREQLEARQLFRHSRKYRFFRWIYRFLWASFKHMSVNIFILGLVLLWMRRKEDPRLEGAVRVLLGDAVAQVQTLTRPKGKILGKLGGKKAGAS